MNTLTYQVAAKIEGFNNPYDGQTFSSEAEAVAAASLLEYKLRNSGYEDNVKDLIGIFRSDGWPYGTISRYQHIRREGKVTHCILINDSFYTIGKAKTVAKKDFGKFGFCLRTELYGLSAKAYAKDFCDDTYSTIVVMDYISRRYRPVYVKTTLVADIMEWIEAIESKKEEELSKHKNAILFNP